MTNSTKNIPRKARSAENARISVVIPSAPERDFSGILENLKQIRPIGMALQIFVVKGKWPPAQRNAGITKADGKYIFLFDDDVIVPEKTFEKIIAEFEKCPSADVIGGPNLTPPQNTFLQHCFGLAHASWFTGAFASARYYPAEKLVRARAEHLISCNLAFRSKVLKENPFDLKIFPNEENELLNRVQKKGYGLKYDPDFLVYHHRRKDLSSYIRQVFAWGRGRALHLILRPRNFNFAFFVPLCFLFYLLSLIFIRDIFYLYPLFLYLIMDLLFSFQAAARGKNPLCFFIMLPLLPLTHIVYALGSLWGLLTFWQKNRSAPSKHDLQIIEIELT